MPRYLDRGRERFGSSTRWLVAALATATTAGMAAAADSAAVFAASGYWKRFTDYWLGGLRETNGIVLFVLGAGAVSLFIITRGKWVK